MPALHQLEEGTFRRLAELSPDAFVAHDGSTILWANQAAASMVGAPSVEALVGRPALELLAPEAHASAREFIGQVLASGAVQPPVEVTLRRPDGAALVVEVVVGPCGPGVVLAVAREVTARRETEARLLESERRHRELLDQVPVAVWEEDFSEVRRFVDGLRARGVTDFHAHFRAHSEDVVACARLARVRSVNATACALTGARDPGELLGSLERVLPPEALPDFAHVVAELAHGQRSTRIDGWNGTLDGARRWVSMRAVLASGHEQDWARLVVTTADITERLQARQERDALHERLRQSEKLEAVGRLAGGVAHDFNNLLAGILALAELAQLEVAPGSPAAATLAAMRAASLRARDLVKQLLTFSKQELPRLQALDLTAVVGEALDLVRAGLQAPVELVANLRSSGTVLADSSQVHQAVLNLCANARDAGARRIEVSLERRVPGPEELAGRASVRLRVQDDGAGMDEATRSRLFEPYLTTRAGQGGHGLGLAVVHGIVTAAGGAVTVSSAPGQGSTFDLWFPLVEAPEAGAPVLAAPKGGSERLLLVDDEPLVRSAHRRVLVSLGYQVTLASDGEEALALLRAQPGAFDLILTDQAMPRLSGFDLARRWLSEQPGARIILCSGFTDDIDEAAATAAGLRALLLKPVPRDVLAAVIRAALD